MPVSVEPACTEPRALSVAGIRGAAVTATIDGDLRAVLAADGNIARKGLQVSSAAPTPKSRLDQSRRRARVAPAAVSMSRFALKALPDTVSPLLVSPGRGTRLVVPPGRSDSSCCPRLSRPIISAGLRLTASQAPKSTAFRQERVSS